MGFDIPAMVSYNPRANNVIIHDNHIDVMFHFLRKYGFPVSLDKVAKGFGMPGKDQSGIDERSDYQCRGWTGRKIF